MSTPVALDRRQRLPLHRRPLPLAAAAVALLLARTRPTTLRSVLEFARREEVVSVSLRCAGQGCLQRSIATVLLCRARGRWPTWCTGVRTSPFAAHAWVEAEGQLVGEPHPRGHYRSLLAIPATRSADGTTPSD